MQFGYLIWNFQLFSIDHAHILLSSLQLNTDNWGTATYVRYNYALIAYFLPQKNTAFEINTFRQAAQLDGGNVDTFVASLRIKIVKIVGFF